MLDLESRPGAKYCEAKQAAFEDSKKADEEREGATRKSGGIAKNEGGFQRGGIVRGVCREV